MRIRQFAFFWTTIALASAAAADPSFVPVLKTTSCIRPGKFERTVEATEVIDSFASKSACRASVSM